MSHRTLLFVSWLAFLPACGGGPDEVWAGDDGIVAGGLVRLELAGTVPDYAVGQVEPYESFSLEGGALPAGWVVRPDDAAAIEEETRPAFDGPWHGILFREKGQLVLPGPFDPERFNRAAVHLALRSKADLVIELRKGREVLQRTRPVRVEGHGKPDTVLIDLPGTLQMRRQADELRLVVVPLGGKPSILGVDLVWTPLASWMPTVEQGPSPVVLGAEARHALALSSKNPLETRVVAPPGASLRFGFGRPLEVLRASDALALTVDVRGRGGRAIGSARLPLASGADMLRWQEGDVELRHDAGEELTVRFSLEGARAGRESLIALASPRLERTSESPPAVLLVTSDTHRADHLGKGGKVRTPFLDRLADEGVLFNDCLAAINITNPSHAALLTGLPARDTGLTDNITALSDEAMTLAEGFQAAGYYTVASLSARHMNHGQSGLGQGFDQLVWPTKEGAIDSAQSLAPLRTWLDEGRTRPMFIWLHVFDAHAPYNVPESHRWLYYDRSRDPYDPDLPALTGRAAAAWDPELRDLEYLVAQYRSEVTYLDEQLAGLLAHPRLADAVVAITADHGEHFGSHGLYWTHQGLYPETLAVPLILSWPGGPRGATVDAPIDQLDLGRTLLDLGGLTWVDFPGHNLLRWVEEPGQEAAPRFAISSHGMAAAVSHEGWYLVLNLRAHTSPRREHHQVELYRPGQDPVCEHDLVDAEPERARELRALLIEWLESAPPQRLARRSGVSDPEVLEQLAALGYATDVGESTDDNLVWFRANPDKNEWDKRFSR